MMEWSTNWWMLGEKNREEQVAAIHETFDG
jgi:hypothetical protein